MGTPTTALLASVAWIVGWRLDKVLGCSNCTVSMERHQRDLVPLGKDGFFKDPFFSSTWEEFDQDRHQMMQKSNGFWDKVDQDMKDFEKSVSCMESDMDRMTAPLRPSLPGWALPDDHKKNWPIILGEGL